MEITLAKVRVVGATRISLYHRQYSLGYCIRSLTNLGDTWLSRSLSDCGEDNFIVVEIIRPIDPFSYRLIKLVSSIL